jgi:4,5-DOPA dioxygenase extradiol
MSATLPAIFFGHGNPMNAVLNNGYTEAWRRIGDQYGATHSSRF